jgi:hypothetical protein
MATKITDPSYISEHMFDRVAKEKFHDNADDTAVRDQAIKFLKMFRAGKTHAQTIVDILHASKISRRDSKESIAEIGFVMGMQFGFELAQSYPARYQPVRATFFLLQFRPTIRGPKTVWMLEKRLRGLELDDYRSKLFPVTIESLLNL